MRVRVLGMAMAAWLLHVADALATAPESLHAFKHVAFSKEAGAPADISSLALDADGYLWMTATKGIVRFDGIAFRPFVPPPGQAYQQAQVSYIFGAEGGGIWMDSDSAGPSLMRNGRLKVYGEDTGYLGHWARFYAGPTGHVRSVNVMGIFEFQGDRWRRVLVPEPGQRFQSVAIDTDGNEWVAMSQGFMVRTSQQGRLVPVVGGPSDPARVFAGRSGRLYVKERDALHIYRRQGVSLEQRALPIHVPVMSLVETRSGALWLTTHSGIRYISPEALAQAEANRAVPVMETFGKADGLTGEFTWPILEDREGNIWVGTDVGLDLFKRVPFNNVKLPPGIHELAAATDSTGNVWVASETHPTLHARLPGPWTVVGPEGVITLAVAYDALRDSAWALNLQGLWRLGRERSTLVSGNPHGGGTGTVFDCLAVDRHGDVVTCPVISPMVPKRWDGSAWHDLPALPEAAKVAAFDDLGTLWMGVRSDPVLVRIRDGKLDVLGAKEGLATGPVRAIYPDGRGVWVGGTLGVQYFDGHRFMTLRMKGQPGFASTTGIVVSNAGHLWVQTLDGVMRSHRSDLATRLAHATDPLDFDVFTENDGIPGAPDPERALPSLRKGPDGRLWTHTTTGLAWIDPMALPEPPVPPVPTIDAVSSANGAHVAPFDGFTLAPGEHDVHIGYTTVALAHPDTLHFAYRLVGLSDRWENVGTRREATFTNLPAGTFRFEVQAINSLGKSAGTTRLVFSRAPSVHETWWFKALLVLPVVAALWLAIVVRTRALTRKMRIRTEEREAVARDIHDTLIQRFQGLTLTMRTWSTNESFSVEHRREISELVEAASGALAEGRERILSLRSGQDHGLGLYNELSAEGTRLAEIHPVAFGLTVSGSPRGLRPEAHRELRDIGIKAMRNAFEHSGGTRVEVSLAWEDRNLWLVIADNGCGMDECTLARALAHGHFGFVGMRERVARLRGTVRVDTAPGEGTEIHVRVPARIAYKRGRRPPRGR